MNTAQYIRTLRSLEERAQLGEDITQEAQALFSSIPEVEALSDQDQKKAAELSSLGFTSSLAEIPEEDFRALISEYEGVIISPKNTTAFEQRLNALVASVTDIEKDIDDHTKEQKQVEEKNKLLKSVINVLSEFI